MSAYSYRVFIKDCLDLADVPVASSVCTAFSVNKDLLSTATSDFTLLEIPNNIKVGDILGLVDPYGTVIYTGVINSIGDTISCREIQSMFSDQWKWHDPTSGTINTVEKKLRSIILSDFAGSSDPMVADRFPFTSTKVVASSSTSGTFETQESNYTMDFEQLLFWAYDTYGVKTEIEIPFGAVSPTITLKKATHGAVKVGNNVLPVRNMTPLTEVFETNKLVIYNNEGTTLRGTYYATTGGVTTNSASPLRPPVTKTKYIFNTDDALADIAKENLQDQIYNHRITFDLILNNGIYDFYTWELGMPISIWYNGAFYSTLYTKYNLSKEPGVDVAAVSITCGKVRNTLTERLNAK